MDLEQAYRQAADVILAADALLIGAGAGMGVDSGLPDFRGPERSEEQQERYHRWLGQIRGKWLAIIELGAGIGVPTVRCECEIRGGTLIRVNPRDTDAPPGSIVLPLGALQAIRALDKM